MRTLNLVAALLLCLLLTLPTLAQLDRGSINGTVNDTSGAVLSKASVVIRSTTRGNSISLTTGETGQYSAVGLVPGAYIVTAEATGFRSEVQQGVEVRVAETRRVDFHLAIGDTKESITVTAEANALQVDTSDIGTAVSRESIQNLPLQVSGAVRDPLAFTRLTPGFAGQTSNSAVEYQTFYSVNGSQTGATSILIDGASVELTSVQSQFNTGVSVEGVEEFKVMASNYSAEFGRSTGGIINLILKSGTNQFHGSAYDFLRNDKLDARGFFSDSRLVNRQNDFGGLLSGPIWIPKVYNGRNKSFFMVTYEGFRYRQGSLAQVGTFPIAPFRDGDFAKLVDDGGKLIPIYDPATTQVLPSGDVTRQVFPANRIPAARFDSVAKSILPQIPTLTFPDRLTNNILSNQQNVVNTNILTMKFDHSFNSNHKITGSFSRSSEANDDLRSFGALGQSGGATQTPTYARLAYDTIITPRIFNHAQFGFSRRWRRESPKDLGDYASKIGLKNVGNTQFPTFNLGGYGPSGGQDNTFGGGPFGNIYIGIDNSYQWNESIAIVRGKHSLKFGGEGRRQQFNVKNLVGYSGILNYGTAQTGLPGAAVATGDPFASFLLGTLNSASLNFVGQDSAHRFGSLGFFAQDDYKVTSKLTLNLGLRWERFSPLTDATGRLTTFDPGRPNPGAGNHLGALIFAGNGQGRIGQNGFQDIWNKAFGPRLGLAYELNQRTVVRLGYGIYYQELKEPGWGGGAEGFFTNVNFNSKDGYSQAFLAGNGFPTDFPKPPFTVPEFSNGRSAAYADPQSGRPPVSQNWQVSIQRQLAQGITLDTAYVATKGNHLIANNIIYNQVDPKYLALGQLLRADINSPAVAAAGIRLPYPGFTGPVNQALRPFPQYQGISTANLFGSDKTGNSIYHSLQMRLQGRTKNGLMFLGSYTWSKLINDGANSRDLDGYNINARGTQDGYNRRAERTLGSMDLPHNFVLSGVYDLPFGRGKTYLQSGVASAIAGGWSLSTVLTYQSGLPIPTPGGIGTNVPLFAGTIRPDRVSGVSSTTKAGADGSFDPGRDRYLDSSAWRAPAAFTFGNASRMSDARLPLNLNEDFALLKSTRLREGLNLQFRAESFNAFNRTIFGLPNLGLSSADFGKIFYQSNRPRTYQMGLKLLF